MTLQEFITKYQNKGIDYDKAYGKQCVDLVNQYAYEVLGIKDCFLGQGIRYAYQIYTNFYNLKNHDKFERIANSKSDFKSYPKPYDIIIWSKERSSSGAGHVAIVISADFHNIKVFEQNYDNKGNCRVYNYSNYNNVLGWLSPLSIPKETKKNRPSLSVGQTVKLKTRSYCYTIDRIDSLKVRICDKTQIDNTEYIILKQNAQVTIEEVINKSNGNIWVKTKYGYIGIYSYKSDTSKV